MGQLDPLLVHCMDMGRLVCWSIWVSSMTCHWVIPYILYRIKMSWTFYPHDIMNTPLSRQSLKRYCYDGQQQHRKCQHEATELQQCTSQQSQFLFQTHGQVCGHSPGLLPILWYYKYFIGPFPGYFLNDEQNQSCSGIRKRDWYDSHQWRGHWPSGRRSNDDADGVIANGHYGELLQLGYTQQIFGCIYLSFANAL